MKFHGVKEKIKNNTCKHERTNTCKETTSGQRNLIPRVALLSTLRDPGNEVVYLTVKQSGESKVIIFHFQFSKVSTQSMLCD